MQPKRYLTFLAENWNLITELFEMNKDGPIDHFSLLKTIHFYRPEMDSSTLVETLLSYDVISQLFSNQTLYSLGELVEKIVENLLNEQQLGLSESIIIHMNQFDTLSSNLLKAVDSRDSDSVFRVIKKINKQTQIIKRQTLHNYKAIQNIVAESKKRDTAIPLRQRYADILDAWDQYITPMGEMIDPWGAFDPNTDKIIKRLEKAVDTLEKVGALISERENIHIAKHMIIDMQVNLIENFKISRELLQPLYEIARLNSNVTRGTSIVLDYVRKDRFNEIERLISEYLIKREELSNIRHKIDNCLLNIEIHGGNRFSSGKDIPARIKGFEESTSDESIENYEQVLQRNETAATKQLGAMLKNLRKQFELFEYEIKRFNRDMNKHQISNIRKIEFIVDENNNILSIIKTLINEDSIFGGDKDIFRVVERFNELINKDGVKISLPNLFNLGISVTLENGKEIKSFGNASIQSTGTDLTVKVVLNVMLLSRILLLKQNHILNIPAYIDEAGQIDPVNQQTLIDQCTKAGFIPIFASVEAQSTAEYWIGLKEVNGKILVDQKD